MLSKAAAANTSLRLFLLGWKNELGLHCEITIDANHLNSSVQPRKIVPL